MKPNDEAGKTAAKKELRASMKARLAAVGAGERAERSERAAAALAAMPAYREASLVFAFLSMSGEIDTAPAIERAMADGKRVAVPRIDGDDIAFVELAAGWRSWPRDRWDIPEPPRDSPVLGPEAVASIHFVSLVPGLAFDRGGGRLGRGKGYYDRWLASIAGKGGVAIGYGFGLQLVDEVPMEAHDTPLDGLALG